MKTLEPLTLELSGAGDLPVCAVCRLGTMPGDQVTVVAPFPKWPAATFHVDCLRKLVAVFSLAVVTAERLNCTLRTN